MDTDVCMHVCKYNGMDVYECIHDCMFYLCMYTHPPAKKRPIQKLRDFRLPDLFGRHSTQPCVSLQSHDFRPRVLTGSMGSRGTIMRITHNRCLRRLEVVLDGPQSFFIVFVMLDQRIIDTQPFFHQMEQPHVWWRALAIAVEWRREQPKEHTADAERVGDAAAHDAL